MTLKLATVNLESAHPQQSKRFYLDLLGMRENLERSHAESFVYLESDGCHLTLAQPDPTRGAEPSRTMELGFSVDDLAPVEARFRQAGWKDLVPQSMGWGQALETHDADGYRVIVYQLKRG